MKKHYGVIYKITNNINDKIYIGQTTKDNPFNRIKYHFRPSTNETQLLYKSFIKNDRNINLYNIEIIYYSFDLQDLNKKEIFFIKYYNSLVPNGYNIKQGGQNGGKASDELRRKLSLCKTGKKSPLIGIKKSKEHVNAMSKSRKGFSTLNRRLAQLKNIEKLKIKLVAKCNKTGVEVCFKSISDCSEYLKFRSDCISNVLNKNRGRTQHKGFSFYKINPLTKCIKSSTI